MKKTQVLFKVVGSYGTTFGTGFSSRQTAEQYLLGLQRNGERKEMHVEPYNAPLDAPEDSDA